MKRVVDGFQPMAAHAEPAGVTVLIESHGDFTRSQDLEEVLTSVGLPQFALLWDAHHTFVAGREKPADTYARLGAGSATPTSRTRGPRERAALRPHGHRRGARRGAGEGARRAGYPGFYCFEWEKKWHPEIEEPEVAFPHFAKTWPSTSPAAGVRAS